jgi:shikimate dehydrogenase
MHNAAFKALKINAEYKLIPLKEQELKPFLASLKEKDICGLNVTVPYKEKVIPFLNNISSEAKLIGAVNTIKTGNNGLEGFNTDGAGFLKHLSEDLKFNPLGKLVAIIGAGGASRAISVYLAKVRPKAISIYDIDKNKLSTLVSLLKANFNGIEIRAAASLNDLKGADLLVNATPQGLKESDPCPADGGLVKENMLVYDLIYNPKETKLLKLAKQLGAQTVNGLGMLLYQGVLAFEIWTGEIAPVEIMRRALT